jgi:hypothetical protein
MTPVAMTSLSANNEMKRAILAAVAPLVWAAPALAGAFVDTDPPAPPVPANVVVMKCSPRNGNQPYEVGYDRRDNTLQVKYASGEIDRWRVVQAEQLTPSVFMAVGIKDGELASLQATFGEGQWAYTVFIRGEGKNKRVSGDQCSAAERSD